MNLVNKIVPKNYTGTESGATSKTKCDTRHHALNLYKQAKYRLLDINNWHRICDYKGAEFKLTDAEGNLLLKPTPEQGNLIRIKLPAPRNKKGDGYDWVRIEKIQNEKKEESDEELCGFRVRPIKKPDSNDNTSAHFYTDKASSTFLVYRKTTFIYVMERGRNEIPNIKGTLFNKLRNALVAITAMLGLSKPQWQKLVQGVLKND